MIDREMASLGYPDDELREKLIDNISILSEETLFESKSTSPSGANQIAEALKRLIDLKDLKDREGKSGYYETHQPAAWEQARKALAQYNAVEPQPEYSATRLDECTLNPSNIKPPSFGRYMCLVYDNPVTLKTYLKVVHYGIDSKGNEDFLQENDGFIIAGWFSKFPFMYDFLSPSQSPQTPIDTEPGEKEEYITQDEYRKMAEELDRPVLNLLKKSGVGFDKWVTNIQKMIQKELGIEPVTVYKRIAQTPRTPISQPGELDTVGEHPSGIEPEGIDGMGVGPL